MNQNNENEVKHTYDGIVEENNPMPMWWIVIFIGCVGFAFLYWMHYTSGSGPTLYEEYSINLQTYKNKIEKQQDQSGQMETEESLTAYMKIENNILEGGSVFSAKCAMCHGEHLEGKIGPNLTDAYWSVGDGSRIAIVNTIQKGSAAKGMPPWEGLLKPSEIKKVASYVYSKIGSNPANAKAPEGIEIKR